MTTAQYSDLSEELRAATRLVGGRIARLMHSAAERLTALEEENAALRPNRRPRIALTTIIDAVALHMRVSVAEITGRRRDKFIVEARDIVVWLARETSGMSLARIGRQLGGRDHSTIRSALQRADAMRADEYQCKRMDRLRHRLLEQARAMQ